MSHGICTTKDLFPSLPRSGTEVRLELRIRGFVVTNPGDKLSKKSKGYSESRLGPGSVLSFGRIGKTHRKRHIV